MPCNAVREGTAALLAALDPGKIVRYSKNELGETDRSRAQEDQSAKEFDARSCGSLPHHNGSTEIERQVVKANHVRVSRAISRTCFRSLLSGNVQYYFTLAIAMIP